MRNIITPLIFSLAILFGLQPASAQPQTFKLSGEGNKNQVKLLWTAYHWPKGLEGFDIKRRQVGGQWQTLNSSPILPSISLNKNLVNVTSETEKSRLRQALQQMISSGQTKEITYEEYIKKLEEDSFALRSLMIPFALSYDFAVLNGFGLIDANIPSGNEYEYGVFLRYEGKAMEQPSGTWKWKYGTVTNVSIEVSAEVLPAGKNATEIKWTVDTDKFKELNLNGFNIHRKTESSGYQKLNQTPIWIDATKKISTNSFFDKNLQENTIYTYAVAPVSFFGTEGNKTEVVFDPSKLPANIAPPVLKHQPTSDPSIEEINLNWEFNPQFEESIKGFRLYRRTGDEDWADVSGLLPPATRTFTDKDNLTEGSYKYVLKAIRTDNAEFESNYLLVLYDPIVAPPAPKELTAQWVREDGLQYIMLEWLPMSADDELTEGYIIYSSFPPAEELFKEGSIPPIKGNTYKYEVYNTNAVEYNIAIAAISADKDESSLSNVVKVKVHSSKMPNVSIWPFSVDSNVVKLEWEYENIADLKGFKIFMNNTLVADANQVGKAARSWTSPKLEYGKSYSFELQAISLYGVESRKSLPISIKIKKKTTQ